MNAGTYALDAVAVVVVFAFLSVLSADVLSDLLDIDLESFPVLIQGLILAFSRGEIYPWGTWIRRIFELVVTFVGTITPAAAMLPVNHPDLIGDVIFAIGLVANLGWLLYVVTRPRVAADRHRQRRKEGADDRHGNANE